MVREHQRELERMALRRLPRSHRRWSISRPLGLVLVRVGRRLAGPDELFDRRPRPLMLTDTQCS
jgi:hypothetical protein